MMLALKSGPQIVAKVGNPAGLLCRRIWYSVGKSGVLGITEYRQGRPLSLPLFVPFCENGPYDLRPDITEAMVEFFPLAIRPGITKMMTHFLVE